MHDPFKCPHCSKFHKDGHPKPEQRKAKEKKEKVSLPYYQKVAPRQFFTYDDVIRTKCEPLPDIQVTEPVIGWRVWSYTEGYLRSVYKTEFAWPHRVPLKKDLYHDNGIHFVKTYKDTLPLLSEYLGVRPNTPSFIARNGRPQDELRVAVAGSCYLWGDVKEHDRGYLAEFAYPKELFVGTGADPMLIMQIEENYGVPVQIRDEVDVEQRDIFYDFMSTQLFSYQRHYQTPIIRHATAIDKSTKECTAIVPYDKKDATKIENKP